MKETKIKATEFIEIAKELKSKRQMMGVKAVDFCEQNNINQGNYSKIENGLANPGKYLVVIRVMFNKWRTNKLKELENQIELLKSIK
jgi:predicted transcriptional regulator